MSAKILKLRECEVKMLAIIGKLAKKLKRLPTYAEVADAAGYSPLSVSKFVVLYKKINKIK